MVSGFLCPSDGNAGRTALNCYFASFGTTTNSMAANCGGGTAPGCGGTGDTGIFTLFLSYALRDITDGASNTVAFAEVLTGKPNTGNTYRGNSVTGVTLNNQVYDISANLNGAKADLQACNVAFQANTNISTDSGLLWAFGATGYTLFNTVQTPNDTQYPFSRGGCGGCGLDTSSYIGASSNHSGGVNVLFGDGSVRFRQKFHQPTNLVGTGNQGRR